MKGGDRFQSGGWVDPSINIMAAGCLHVNKLLETRAVIAKIQSVAPQLLHDFQVAVPSDPEPHRGGGGPSQARSA
eukprot:3250665-Rhodomonas_salina.1